MILKIEHYALINLKIGNIVEIRWSQNVNSINKP